MIRADGVDPSSCAAFWGAQNRGLLLFPSASRAFHVHLAWPRFLELAVNTTNVADKGSRNVWTFKEQRERGTENAIM